MKTIKCVDEKLTSFDQEMSAELVATMPTFRKMFRAAIGMFQAKNGDEAVDFYQVGLKLRATDPDLTLEDAEFKILREACDKNPAQWMSHYQGQVLMKLKEAEK